MRGRAGAYGCADSGTHADLTSNRSAFCHADAHRRANTGTHADSTSNRSASSHTDAHGSPDYHAGAYPAPNCDAQAPRR